MSEKGQKFERSICKTMSLWVSCGTRSDLFWRTAMSGGRATVVKGVQQGGDLTAVAEEGHALTDYWLVECKHHRQLEIAAFLLKGTGRLARFWAKAQKQAHNLDRAPMLIACQNNFPILVIVPSSGFNDLVVPSGKLDNVMVSCAKQHCDIVQLTQLIKYNFFNSHVDY